MTTNESAKPSRSPNPSSSEKSTKLHKAQRFLVERIHRSQIRNAPYNPRTIDAYAKAKLEKNLRKVGLLEPLVWNKRTGNLVGGHQRLSCLDAIAGTDDYELDLSVVDLTEKQEREQNIALNNPSMQGSYDVASMADLLKFPELDLSATGFDQMDLEVMFDGSQLSEIFAPKATDPELPEPAKKKPRERASLTERRKDMLAAAIERDDSEFYCVAVFKNRAQRERFMVGIGLESDDRYCDGMRLATLLGIELEDTKAA